MALPNPIEAVAGVDLIGPREVVGNGLNDQSVASEDPSRVWLLLMWRSTAIGDPVRPAGSGLNVGLHPPDGQTFLLLHTSVMPGLVQGAWTWTSGLGSLVVWEGRRVGV